MRKTLNSPAQRALQAMLRAARVEAGLTQAQLARALSKPQSFVSKIEVGERMVDVIEMIEILFALRVAPDDFVRRLAQSIAADLETELPEV